jgi:hypothetical protein
MAKLDERGIEELLRLWEAYFDVTSTTQADSLGGFWDVVHAIRQIATQYGWRTRQQRGHLWFTRQDGRRFCITYPTTPIRRSNVTDLKNVLREIQGGRP